MMVSVITGDIINSTKAASAVWLKVLKNELNKTGAAPKAWEIYRGDSFQVLVRDPARALLVAVKIKAALIAGSGTDVRMAIGIGSRTRNAAKITQSNGSAFVHSGEQFELLKRDKQNLCIKSDSEQFDKEMNLYLKLSLIVMDSWTQNAAAVVKAAMDYPKKSQQQLGKLLGIRQNAVSSRLRRAHYEEIMQVNDMYETKLKMLK